ncbi:hypothetical protein BAMY6614_12935 [Bacillus amyloliquefaciens UMAF6614]|nr:hypothetical protein BAMY6614_12935 [Bacillus amyloliquefaciens UMAF6614]
MEVYKKRKPSFYPVHCDLITIWMLKMLCESKPLSFFESAFICRSLADKIEEMLYHFFMFLM